MCKEQETTKGTQENFQKESEQVNEEFKKEWQKPDIIKVEKPEILNI